MRKSLLVLALLLVALPAQAVTRLYFGSHRGVDFFITPTADAGWEDATGIFRGELHVGSYKARSQNTGPHSITLTPSSANQDISAQWQILMPSGVTFTSGVTTVTMQAMASESVATADVNQCILGMRVIDNDGSTVSATLLAVANYGTTTELNTAARNKTCADGDTVSATYTTAAGDWLVVETGFQNDGATGASSIATELYSDGSGYTQTLGVAVSGDCPVDETTADCAGWLELSNTWTPPAEAGPATRLYFPASETPLPPGGTAANGQWTHTNELQFRRLSHTKGTSTLTDGQTVDMVDATTNLREVDRIYLSDPMRPGTVFTQGQTVISGQIMARELASTDNVTGIGLSAHVVSFHGGTKQADLLDFADQVGNLELDATAVQNRPLLIGSAVINDYTTVVGDRLSIELGFFVRVTGGGTTPQALFEYGEDATDCSVAFTGTGCAGWVEISGAVEFVANFVPRPQFFGRLLMVSPRDLARSILEWW